MLQTYQRQSKQRLITTVLAVLVVAGIVLVADHLKAKSSSRTTSATTPTTSTPTTSNPTISTTNPTTSDSSSTNSSSTSSGYKDGTYNASSTYFVPHGQESISVDLTLSGGVVKNVSIQNSESDGTSAFYQEQFASEYQSLVVGKKISGLQIAIISGASDTTQGFNEALSQIATQAQT